MQLTLGLAWSHCTSKRLYVGMKNVNDTKVRYIIVVFSPHLGDYTSHFNMTPIGVENVA